MLEHLRSCDAAFLIHMTDDNHGAVILLRPSDQLGCAFADLTDAAGAPVAEDEYIVCTESTIIIFGDTLSYSESTDSISVSHRTSVSDPPRRGGRRRHLS